MYKQLWHTPAVGMSQDKPCTIISDMMIWHNNCMHLSNQCRHQVAVDQILNMQFGFICISPLVVLVAVVRQVTRQQWHTDSCPSACLIRLHMENSLTILAVSESFSSCLYAVFIMPILVQSRAQWLASDCGLACGKN